MINETPLQIHRKEPTVHIEDESGSLSVSSVVVTFNNDQSVRLNGVVCKSKDQDLDIVCEVSDQVEATTTGIYGSNPCRVTFRDCDTTDMVHIQILFKYFGKPVVIDLGHYTPSEMGDKVYWACISNRARWQSDA